jgi:hypothetical protein
MKLVTARPNQYTPEFSNFPSWNRRSGPKGRGGSKVEKLLFRNLFDLATTPALRATPPVPGGVFRFPCNPFTTPR